MNWTIIGFLIFVLCMRVVHPIVLPYRCIPIQAIVIRGPITQFFVVSANSTLFSSRLIFFGKGVPFPRNKSVNMVVRTYQEECSYIEKLTSHSFKIKKGFVDNMQVLWLYKMSTVFGCSCNKYAEDRPLK